MNPFHGPDGKFSSGSAANGDHQASATPDRTPRMAVKAHAGVPSVGTSTRGFSVRVRAKGPKLDTAPAEATGGRRAVRERRALNQATDRRHYPNESADVAARFRARATGSR